MLTMIWTLDNEGRLTATRSPSATARPFPVRAAAPARPPRGRARRAEKGRTAWVVMGRCGSARVQKAGNDPATPGDGPWPAPAGWGSATRGGRHAWSGQA
jgi:hypothetical protein